MSDWTHVGDSLGIHNLCLYDKLNLPLRENSLFACCQYGGPLAIGLAYTTPNSWAIGIYMQNGAQIASIEASGVYRLFWSKCQKLIIVSSNGRVLIYNALGVHLVAFNMGDETLAVGLAEAAAFCYVNETGNEPGSLLFDAERKMEQKSHQAYEYVRSISAQQMPEAVDQCLEAAADHFDPKVQKQLLRAASIGIRRCDRPYDPDRFVHICRVLRVLNALRPMGIPLTHQQLNELSLSSVIDRLASLNHWPLSIKLCNFLNLPPKNGVFKVLGHWCLAMMERYKERQRDLAMAAEERHAQTEEGLAQRMVAKLAEYPTISYADIAEMASRQELPTLASILLELEPDTTRQVTVMLKLKQLDKALHKAAHSQRPDLLLLVIRHLRNTLTSRDMELLLRKVPQALSIYQFEQYVKSKKSPLGYLPVIRLCAAHGNKNLAFRLMDRVNVYEEQVQAYLILGEVKKAATLAAEKEDVQMLQNIKCRFPPSSANWDEVKKIMDTLLKKAT
uniref:Vacuolar protein sorting-associated protein 16 homolog n=1 Tax=Globodera pallida TaxID=36090 RepID=A0A183C4E4_GLOPA